MRVGPMLLVLRFGVGLRSRFVAEGSRRASLCIALVGLCAVESMMENVPESGVRVAHDVPLGKSRS